MLKLESYFQKKQKTVKIKYQFIHIMHHANTVVKIDSSPPVRYYQKLEWAT